MKQFQPYETFTVAQVNEFVSQNKYYLVSQFYARGFGEAGQHKIPVLFTAYAQFDEALLHYQAVEARGDEYAALTDISKKEETERILNICSGYTYEFPFISQVPDLESVNTYIKKEYEEKIKKWIDREKEKWEVDEVHTPQPGFAMVIGEPVVMIRYGNYAVVASLEELDGID